MRPLMVLWILYKGCSTVLAIIIYNIVFYSVNSIEPDLI